MPPQAKDSFYFSHDSNARNDVKMIAVRRKLGMAGYGLYFCIIEILREQADYKMKLAAIDDIAFNLSVTAEQVNDIIKSYDLFKIEGDSFYSESLIRRMAMYNEMKDKLSKAGKKGMDARWGKKEESTAAPLKRIM